MKTPRQKHVISALLFSFILASVLMPQFPFYIQEVNGQYEGISYDGVHNIFTFNQNSTTFIDDLYGADTSNALTLLSSDHFLCWSKENSPSTWLNETSQANEGTADDMTLMPMNSGTPVGDYYAIGNVDNIFSSITINITTAGSWTSSSTTIRLEYSSSSTLFAFQDSTDYDTYFKSTGQAVFSFIPKVKDTTWKKGTLNGVSAYWMRFRVTALGGFVTTPKGGQVWLKYPFSTKLGTVQPMDSLTLQLTVTINQTTFVSSGAIEFLLETLTIDNSTDTYLTSFSYATETTVVTVTGEYSFILTQPRWGIIGQVASSLFDYSWTLIAAGQIGDGSTIIEVSDTLKQLYIPNTSWTSTTHTHVFRIMENATFTLGTLVDENTRVVRRGLQIFTDEAKLILGEEGSKVYLYDLRLSSSAVNELKLLGLDNRIYGSTLLETNLKGYNYDIDTIFAWSVGGATRLIRSESGTEFNATNINRVTIGGYYSLLSLAVASQDIIVRNLYARNITKVLMLIGGNNPDVYLIDSDLDSWDITWFVDYNNSIYRQYSFDLTVTYPNGTAFENANVTITYYGQGGGTAYSGTTDSNGQIPTQTFTYGFYNRTGQETIYDYNPYKISITNSDRHVVEWNFTLDKPINWAIPLEPNIPPSARFTFNPSNPQPSQTVSFNASQSADSDGSIVNYYWTFGDGYSYNGSSSTANHSYGAGIFTATLEVTDNQGAKDTFSHVIIVTSTESVTTTGPSQDIFPDFDVSLMPLPEYTVYVPLLSETFPLDVYLHNKGKFGKEIQVLFWIENIDGEKIYEKSESLFVNPLETRDLSVTLTKPSEAGQYTVYAKIPQARTKTAAQQSFQTYDLISWFVGPGIILTVLIIIAVVAIAVVCLKVKVFY